MRIKAKVAKRFFKGGFYISLMFVFILGISMITQYFIDNPNDFSFREYYEWKPYEKPPAELLEKKGQMDLFRSISLICVSFAILVEYCNYKIDPKNHALYKLFNRVNL